MKNLAQTSTVLAALLGVSGALAVAAIGCGGDDTSTQGDATADQTTDVTTGDGATSDVKQKGDASTDGNVGDAAGDAVSDAAPLEAAPVDAAALHAFPNAVNTAYCKRLASCCGVTDAGPDAGEAAFVATCVASYEASGGVADVNLANVHSGNITLDPTSAQACLDDIAAITCGSYMSAEAKAYLSDCSAAMVGHLPLNSTGCSSAWDCEPPAFCQGSAGAIASLYSSDGGIVGVFVDNASDGGTPGVFLDDGGYAAGAIKGTCTGLRPVGSSCTDVNYYTDCTLYGNGSPAAFCNENVAGTGATCVANYATGAAGAGCLYNQQCQTEVCIYGVGCSATGVFSDPGDASVICSGY